MGAKNAACTTRGERGDTLGDGRQRTGDSAEAAECGAVDGLGALSSVHWGENDRERLTGSVDTDPVVDCPG